MNLLGVITWIESSRCGPTLPCALKFFDQIARWGWITTCKKNYFFT